MQKSQLLLPLCELLMINHFDTSDQINLLSLKNNQIYETLD